MSEMALLKYVQLSYATSIEERNPYSLGTTRKLFKKKKHFCMKVLFSMFSLYTNFKWPFILLILYYLQVQFP